MVGIIEILSQISLEKVKKLLGKQVDFNEKNL
jgi:hypothetical protein